MPASRCACLSHRQIDRAEGPSSFDSDAGVLPLRANSTIWRLNSAAYRKLLSAIPNTSKLRTEVSTKTGQLHWRAILTDSNTRNFFVKFQARRRSRSVTLALTHTPGDQLFVDYAGDAVPFTGPSTGLEQRAWLFVAVWPYSAKLYAEATRTQTSADWLSAHVRALEAFGCAPRALVPDNCTTAVRKALRYDPQFNRSCAELAEHYCLAVLPARVREPCDKAAVENPVLLAERAVFGGLRNRKFFSLAELNAAIHAVVAAIDAEPFQKRGARSKRSNSRASRAVNRPLPPTSRIPRREPVAGSYPRRRAGGDAERL